MPQELNELLVREQARQLYHNASSSTVTQISVAALFYILFHDILNSNLLVIWCFAVFVITLSRLILVRFCRKIQPKNTLFWLNVFTFFTLLVGVTWASFSLFYIEIDDVGLKYLFFVIICGVVAGSVPILGAWTPAFYANTLPQIITVPIVLLSSYSTVNSFLAISFVIYCIMLLALQKRANENIRLTFQLRQKSDALISELNSEIEQREQLIEERTQQLQQSLTEQNAIVENNLIGIAIVHQRRIQWANSAFEAMFGYQKGEVVGCQTRQFYSNEVDYEAVGKLYNSIADGVIQNELEFRRKDGRLIWVNIKGSVLNEEKGQSLWMFVDVTERKQSEEKLRLSYQVFNDTHDGITITDKNKNIIDVNPAFCDITGYTRDEAIGQNPSFLSSGKQTPEFYADMWQVINERGHWQGEIWNRKKNGEVYAELLTISELRDTNGILTNYVGIFSDITKSKQQQETLKLLAHYDVLTSLPNRILLTDRFHQAIAHSKRSGTMLAVCFLDLDHFKPINDKFGHEVGDLLLIEVAHRISACVREEDTVARLGGDEFALLLSNLSMYEQCEQTIERIHYSIAQPYLIEGMSHNVSASSGITLYPIDDGDVDTLLRHADQAMYLAKQAGRNCYHLFNKEQEQEATDKNYRLTEISHALSNNELCLYYQPKVNMLTGKVFGAEALIRWNHPEQGLVPPLEFLPILDGSQLDLVVGAWVIESAIHQLDLWQQQDIELEISINVTSHYLLSDNFYTQLEQILAKYPAVNANSVQMEMLESSNLSDVHAISRIIKQCRDSLGISFALDDFGTGYSSLTHLRNLPADTVKIDQSFVRDILDDPNDYTIVAGVIGLADSFNRHVIAEGVETTAHGKMLILMGCKQAQGYAIAKPMPADQFLNWWKNYVPNQIWLACMVKHLTTREKQVLLFKLVSEQWFNYFESNINSSPEDIQGWPIMDRELSYCGFWIKGARKLELFKDEKLTNLLQLQMKACAIGQDLFDKYQHGFLDEAREGLATLHTAFNEMNAILD